jgi:hypothetical protein
MPPDSTILRYLNVRKLAERGAPGERENARHVQQKMEADYPNIRQSAAEYDRKHRQGTADAGTPPSQPPTYKNPNGWDWSNLFRYGQAFVNGVSGVAQTIGNASAGYQLAEHVDATVRAGRTDNILFTLKLPASVYAAATELNEVQMHAFRSALHEQLDHLLDQAFIPEGEEEEEEEGEEEDEDR